MPVSEFWSALPGLVWSNPEADDSTRIRAALLKPYFTQLLEIAVAFGLDRLKEEWRILELEGTAQATRAKPAVRRILRNIERGRELAASGD